MLYLILGDNRHPGCEVSLEPRQTLLVSPIVVAFHPHDLLQFLNRTSFAARIKLITLDAALRIYVDSDKLHKTEFDEMQMSLYRLCRHNTLIIAC